MSGGGPECNTEPPGTPPFLDHSEGGCGRSYLIAFVDFPVPMTSLPGSAAPYRYCAHGSGRMGSVGALGSWAQLGA
jgi:hypothetical protein